LHPRIGDERVVDGPSATAAASYDAYFDAISLVLRAGDGRKSQGSGCERGSREKITA
jgi:hypothetical protein